jgi:hypothetical protein
LIYCYDFPLLISALSGIASIDGMPCNCRNLNGHGYIAYPDKVDCTPLTPDILLEKASAHKIEHVIYFDQQTRTFKKIKS